MSGFRPMIGGGGMKPVKSGSHPPSNNTNSSAPEKSWWQFSITTWLLIFGLLVINAGIFVKPELMDRIGAQLWRCLGFVDVRFWPWWYWPVFWIIVIGLVTRCLLAERIEIAEVQGEDSDQLRQLRRLVTIIAVGLTVVLICVHSNLVETLRAMITSFYGAEHPWWSVPLCITLIIGVLGGIRAFQYYRENNDLDEWNLRTILWMSLGSIAGMAVILGLLIAYANGAFASLSLPWWGWPLFWIVVIGGLLTYKIIATFHGKEATVQTTPKPIQQTAVKPKGFNASIGNRTQVGFRARPATERTPLLERLGLSGLSEMGMIVWLVPVGLVLLAVVGYFCYRLFTTEWIDAEGYPISRPWWLWMLPFLFLTLGAGIWKVVLVMRENAESKPVSRPTPPNKPQKPKGFNMQPPDKRK